MDLQTRITTITGLQSELAVYHDIEMQLRTSREHEQQMFVAKQELQRELETAAGYI